MTITAIRFRKETADVEKPNVLIIGAGGVAQVVAHKVAQWAAEFGDIHMAQKTPTSSTAPAAASHPTPRPIALASR